MTTPSDAPPSPQPLDIPTLLRFLTQDAKIPLPQALPLAKPLHAMGLATPVILATSKVSIIKTAIVEPNVSSDVDTEKLAKQIFAAAKRLAKKRSLPAGDGVSASTGAHGKKRRRTDELEADAVGGGRPESYPRLPTPSDSMETMATAVVNTNRAPLLLAFTVVSLAYTMPSQPEESRLSLGMAVMSAGARARARDLGIAGAGGGARDQDEDFGRGGRRVRVLGKNVPVLRREGVAIVKAEDEQKGSQANAKDGEKSGEVKTENEEKGSVVKPEDEPSTSPQHQHQPRPETETEPAYWGLDTSPPSARSRASTTTSMPIHTAQSAHAYLLKSFATSPTSTSTPTATTTKAPKASKASLAKEKEENTSLLLGALHALFSSWAPHLSALELDNRAWGWYVRVRPAVEAGAAGWGGKGDVRLQDILSLRRQ